MRKMLIGLVNHFRRGDYNCISFGIFVLCCSKCPRRRILFLKFMAVTYKLLVIRAHWKLMPGYRVQVTAVSWSCLFLVRLLQALTSAAVLYLRCRRALKRKTGGFLVQHLRSLRAT